MKRDLRITRMDAGHELTNDVTITATNYADDHITINVGKNEEGFKLHDFITVEITKRNEGE